MPDETRVGDLLLRWEELRQQGVDVPAAELCAGCPELLPEVRRQIEALRAVDPLLTGTHSGIPGPDGAAAGWPSVPGYEIEAELGRGGMGVVYRARQTLPNRLVALKMIRGGVGAGPKELVRFLAEAETVARLQHPHIVQVFEFGRHAGCPYFTMELVEGSSLDRLLGSTPQPAEDCARFVEALARAVDFAHQRGVVHRDLKPANVLLAPEQSPERQRGVYSSLLADARGSASLAEFTPMITDFGLVKQIEVGSGLTQSGAVLGTPSYMAPEQALGQGRGVGPAADTYALGAILYELLTGRPPFRGDTALETLRLVTTEDPVPPAQLRPGLPRDLETVCLKCLQKDPQKRYSAACGLADDLRRFLDGVPVVARPTPSWERAAKWVRSNPAAVTLTAVGVLVLFGTVVAVALHNASLGAALSLADERRREAEQRRQEADANLNHGLVREARLTRLAAGPGYRTQAWERIRQAMQLPTTERDLDELRQEAVACLGDGLGLEPTTWADFPADVLSLDLHPDGNLAALGLADGTIRLRDLRSGAETVRMHDPGARVQQITFAASGRKLLSATRGGRVKAWEPDADGTWRCRHAVPCPGGDEAAVRFGGFFALGPDENLLACAVYQEQQIELWDLAAESRTAALPLPDKGELLALALSPDGKFLAAAGTSDGGLALWDVPRARAELATLGLDW